jgi:precorrin-4/cobalt-precorrin-4 C11-methyltransferase
VNRVYFLGAGPGDPGLLTLRAAQLLTECHVVYAPVPFEQTFAAHLQGKTVLVPFDYYFKELLELIEKQRQTGQIAFLVPGDMTFYSPFQPLVDALGERAVVVPGVGTANAAAAYLKKTLDLPGVCNHAILASPRTLGDSPDAPTMGDLAAPGVTLLIYMNNLPLPELVRQLRAGYGCNAAIAILHRLGLPEETVVQGTLDDIVARVGDRDFFNLESPDRRPALTLVVVGESLAAATDGNWWDHRREHIWKVRGAELP